MFCACFHSVLTCFQYVFIVFCPCFVPDASCAFSTCFEHRICSAMCVGNLFFDMFVGNLFFDVRVGKLLLDMFVGDLFFGMFVGNFFVDVCVGCLSFFRPSQINDESIELRISVLHRTKFCACA